MVQDHEARPGSEFIFVAGPGRCGTSLLAGIMSEQGAWTGSARTTPHQRAPKGFYENVDFRTWLRDVCKFQGVFPDARRGVQQADDKAWPLGQFQQQLERPLVQAGWKRGQPIVLKNPLVVYAVDVLDMLYPYAHWIVAKREPNLIVQSQIAGYGGDPEQWLQWVDWYYDEMIKVPHFEVDVSGVVNLHTQEMDKLRDVADRAGLESWDLEAVRNFIVPGALHV